ncbi:hypothetical protein COCOR_00939 [Corallococcus coralloides DSM 2259]|uniref:Uncharacterized protein n=1 Tax=Corallococcus coralloides (strain ATCC 25202 / DSM 2259 / NBRC 100086 / M2) TaxID=1144275 RepID=H8MLF7_CORCM|nr:hypothetical protein [Corallococcus coralloides]AFE03794.1 hypothetical protein COCOR_00939 [Corallococcus coralloides DSM 2259]
MSKELEIDVEDVLAVLGDETQRHEKGSREWNALQVAAICLVYVRHMNKLDDFTTYYREILSPDFKIKVERDFVTRDEAESWLKSGDAEDGMQIRIDGKGFLVVRLPGRLTLLNNPLPEELGTDNSED